VSKNRKQSSPDVTHLAAVTLSNSRASDVAKRLAASVVAQASSSKQTGPELEDLASRVLQSEKYSDDTKTLAGSVLAQSNVER
jgi:hypothetical protein